MNILITGVSQGLGLVLTKIALSKGHFIYGISSSKNTELEQLLMLHRDHFKWLKYDLTNSHNIPQKIFKEWIGIHNPIHGFVNNAAIAYDDIITNMDMEALIRMYQINVFSALALTKYIIRNFLLHTIKGSIVHLSSISVHTGYKGLAMYASTKGAMEAFSKNTAREWGKRGIRSNCLVAGFMETSMNSKLSSEQKSRIYKRTSLKAPTSINSVALTILYLLSKDAKSITGQNIFVDNGSI